MGVTDFFTDEITTELLKQLMDITRQTCLCKGSAEQLIATIHELQPIIREIQHSGVELSQTRQSQLSGLMRNLQEGMELCRTVKASSRWNVYRNLQLARKMEKIEKRITAFTQGLLLAHTLADVHHVRSKMAERFDVLQGSTRRIEQWLTEMTVGSGGGGGGGWPKEEVRTREEASAAGWEGGFGGEKFGAAMQVGNKRKVGETIEVETEDLREL